MTACLPGGEERGWRGEQITPWAPTGRQVACLPSCVPLDPSDHKQISRPTEYFMMKLAILVLGKGKGKKSFFENTSVSNTTRHGYLVYIGQEENQCVGGKELC